jgi:hypothetical protein
MDLIENLTAIALPADFFLDSGARRRQPER